ELALLARQHPDPSSPEHQRELADLIARKQLEHDLEERFGISLTCSGGEGRDRAGWKLDELRQLDAALSQLPPELLGGKPNHQQIRRERVQVSQDRQGNRVEDRNTGGTSDQSTGIIRIFDAGTAGRMRNTGAASSSTGGAITVLQETLVHEIGHNLQLQNK